MTETYWLCGCACLPDELADALPVMLRQVALRLEQVPEVHLFGAPPHGWKVPVQLPVYAWPASPAEEHRLLHLVFQSVQASQPEMALLVEVWNGRAAAALLGSPSAAGRRNLLPLARLSAESGHGHVSGLTGLRQAQAPAFEPAQAPAGDTAQAPAFDPAQAQPGPHAEGLLYQFQHLIRRLQTEKAGAGMAQTMTGGVHLLATRVERI